jgi:hypothetical protein
MVQLMSTCKRLLLSHIALDNFVQFAAVQPHPAALRSIVDLDTLEFAYDQLHLTYRAFHSIAPLLIECST